MRDDVRRDMAGLRYSAIYQKDTGWGPIVSYINWCITIITIVHDTYNYI